MKREFHLQDDRSSKFWTITVVGEELITENGRIGAKPRQTRTRFNSNADALRAAEREILGKRRKGYVEGDASELPPHSKRLPPRWLRIRHDDDKARYVGRTANGMQFFLTFPFAPRMGEDSGGNYIALYLFDEFGMLQRADIYDERKEGLGSRSAVDRFVERLLENLGVFKFGDINISPFSLQAFGRAFGLIFDPGEDGDDEDDEDVATWVTAEPGNYMAFYPPWDGDYDT